MSIFRMTYKLPPIFKFVISGKDSNSSCLFVCLDFGRRGVSAPETSPSYSESPCGVSSRLLFIVPGGDGEERESGWNVSGARASSTKGAGTSGGVCKVQMLWRWRQL